jgi:hypothetical protein
MRPLDGPDGLILAGQLAEQRPLPLDFGGENVARYLQAGGTVRG